MSRARSSAATRRRAGRFGWAACLLALAAPLLAPSGVRARQAGPEEEAARLDRRTGLRLADGFEVVVKECTSCHSASFIRQNRGRREDWLGMIRWMQATQELRQFEPETETAILDYLSTNYGIAERRFRRPPLAAELLPPPAQRSDRVTPDRVTLDRVTPDRVTLDRVTLDRVEESSANLPP